MTEWALKVQEQDDTRNLRAADQGSTGFRDYKDSKDKYPTRENHTIYTKPQ